MESKVVLMPKAMDQIRVIRDPINHFLGWIQFEGLGSIPTFNSCESNAWPIPDVNVKLCQQLNDFVPVKSR